MSIHHYLSSFKNVDDLLTILFSKIDEYKFTCSYKGKTVPKELKEKYVKTYFAKYNAVFYKQLKEKYNASDRTDIADLYLLLIYYNYDLILIYLNDLIIHLHFLKLTSDYHLKL